MQAVQQFQLKTEIQGVYERAYYQALSDATPNKVHISITTDGGTNTYVEKNFYFCGFNYIKFKAVGKNRELVPLANGKDYPSGFYLKADELGQRGNGDFEIQRVAYAELADHLNGLGYDVYHDSRLD